MSQKSRNKRIAFVAIIMLLLINYPLLTISAGGIYEGELPHVLVYIMIIWFIVIMLYYILTEWSAKTESKEKS